MAVGLGGVVCVMGVDVRAEDTRTYRIIARTEGFGFRPWLDP